MFKNQTMKNININKALPFLYIDEDTLSVEEMVKAIYEMSLRRPEVCIDAVEGVEVIESMQYSSLNCGDFMDMLYDPYQNLKLAIDSESVNIYIDNGDDQEPTHVVYWHEDEWLEDAETVVPAVINAINLYHTNPKELLDKLGIEL